MGSFPCDAQAGLLGSPYGEGSYGTGPYGEGVIAAGFNPIQYYINLLTSEYKNSSNLNALVALLSQPFMDVMLCLCSLPGAFNLNAALGSVASGVQLDSLGQLIGAGRTLPFQPVGVNALTTEAISSTGTQTVTVNNTSYMQIGTVQTITGSDGHTESVVPTAIVHGVSFTAVFTLTHVSGSSVTTVAPSAILGDSDYLTLLRAKIIQNQFNGLYMGANSTLWQDWQSLFPGGKIYITDNQNMTATILVLGSFSIVQQQMITNGLIVPHCQAVEFTFIFPELPAFGFGSLNPTIIQGFGTGYWNG
jgi:Protein of unknown function (DUF2612)